MTSPTARNQLYLAQNVHGGWTSASEGVRAIMIINLSGYRAALAADVVEHSRYDEEVLCANWNYAIQLIAAEGCQYPQESLSSQLPEDFSNTDIDAFLNRVYALATGI